MDKPHNRLDVSFSFSSATGCVTQREQTGTQEVLADKNKASLKIDCHGYGSMVSS